MSAIKYNYITVQGNPGLSQELSRLSHVCLSGGRQYLGDHQGEDAERMGYWKGKHDC